MQLLPITWAGKLSVVLCGLFLILFVAQLFKPDIWVLRMMLFLAGIVVLSAGIDSVVVHKERAVLVFVGMIINFLTLVFVISKSLLR